MRIKIATNNKHLKLGVPQKAMSTKKVECVKPISSRYPQMRYCAKCGCLLFEEEIACPYCLFPMSTKSGWTA